MVKAKQAPKFSWWDLVKLIAPYLLTLLLGGGAVYSTQMMGCPGPRPKPPVVVPPDPPAPVVKELKKLILVRESGLQSDAMARLITSLQGGKGMAWLDSKGIELVAVVDPGDVNSEGGEAALVKKWKERFSGKDQLLLLDEKGEFIRSVDIPEAISLDAFQALCTDHAGEPQFADLPYVDCDWTDWPQFSTGDKSENGKFNGAVDPVESVEPVLKGAEPKFGQGAVSENPAEGEPVFEDAIPLIPREQWPTAIKALEDQGGGLDLLVTRIYDQKSEGSCVSNATCQAMEIIQAMRSGRKNVVHLSAISLYKRCGNSPGSGSMVSTNLKEILATGVLPLDNAENKARFKHTMANTGFYDKYPDGWKETAKRFRGYEVYDVRSYDGFITALLRGYPVTYGRSGHSIVAVRPVYKNGQLYCMFCNSWSSGWGVNGFGFDSESKIRSGAGWAFALRTVVDHDVAFAAHNNRSVALAPATFPFVKGWDGDSLLKGPSTLNATVQR